MAHYNEMIMLLLAHKDASTQAIKDSVTDALKLAFDAIIDDRTSIDARIVAEYNSGEGRRRTAAIKVARDLLGVQLREAKEYADKVTGHNVYQRAERDALHMTRYQYDHIVQVDDRDDNIRQGQEMMNRCYRIHPLMHSHLVNKGLDCFYSDDKIDAVVGELSQYVSA